MFKSSKVIYAAYNIYEHLIVLSMKHSFIISRPEKLENLQHFTVMILSFQTDRSEQTVQTQIRLLLEEQSDQGLQFAIPFASF